MTMIYVHVLVEVEGPSGGWDMPIRLGWKYRKSTGDNPRYFGSELAKALHNAHAVAIQGAAPYYDLPESTNLTEHAEDRARRYARQLEALAKGLRDRGYSLAMTTEDKLVDYVLSALDERDADAKANAQIALQHTKKEI